VVAVVNGEVGTEPEEGSFSLLTDIEEAILALLQ